MLNELSFVSDHSGWIEVICGGMFSGKTEELIRRAKAVPPLAKQDPTNDS